MAYIPNIWQARTGTGLNRWRDQNDALYIFTPDPTEIVSEGTPFSPDWMNHLEQGVAANYEKPLRSTNLSVSTGSWASDATYTDYPYRAAVPVTGALASMTPEVVLALADAVSGILAPVAEAYAGGIYIYASEVPAATVTIATLTLWKAVS